MQSASKRVRTIYSVIASSNRLEILRILNSKGPLSYSELKTLSGFKSKKESGKFAYHLRKLVRQMLVSLNRAERRYTVTSLGRLILNLTRQIEEQSVIESGKLFVRTSRHRMEEFNPNRILQSLVREAGMPVELAQKMTSEAETRLYKFQTTYLTAPLIREMVNALLVEHGYEEYRHRLTRLGTPVYDVTQMINTIASRTDGIDSLISQAAGAVFSDYLLLSQLPRDVADAHLAGDIHISHIRSWGLKPDSIFIDPISFPSRGINFGGRLLDAPRLSPATKITDALSTIVILTELLKKEVSQEIAITNFLGYIARYVDSRSAGDLRDILLQTFKMMSQHSSLDSPSVSIHLTTPAADLNLDEIKIAKARKATLEAYGDYITSVSVPSVRLVVSLDGNDTEVSQLGSIVSQGGFVSISTNGDPGIASSGIRRSVGGQSSGGIRILHGLSLNLPRLAYESNRDDTYFRAKLALLLQVATSALFSRRNIIEDLTRKGLLPLLSRNSGLLSNENMPLILNFTGLDESISTLTDSKASLVERNTMAGKIVETALKICNEKGEELGAEFGISAVIDDSGKRLAGLDSDKYGKSSVSAQAKRDGYSQVPRIESTELLKDDVMNGLNAYAERLNGGCATVLNVRDLTNPKKIGEVGRVAARRLKFFKFGNQISICKTCGLKITGHPAKCSECGSASFHEISTL